jgi:hypothetical protein
MAAQTPTVGVVGMRALARDISKLADDTSGPLLSAFKAAGRTAAEPVAGRARESVPHVSGALAGDVRITSARTGASVRMGRASIPYAGPVDFGGWPEGREYRGGGRYLFPAAADLAGRVVDLYSDAMSRVFASAGVWENTTDDPEAVHD